MDLIAADIGNSNISLAVFTNQKLYRSERLAIDRLANTDIANILAAYREMCPAQPLGARTVPVVVSSVNTPILEIFEKAVSQTLKQNTLVIGRDFPLEMKMAVENPKQLGSDRLLNAFAAYEVIETALVVADFGTATTIDCVNDNGIFLGGVILPGLNLAAKSLNQYTDALPLVKPTLPTGAYGINTTAAIENGIYYGALGALREMTERYAEEFHHWPQVVVTGGFCKLIAQKCDFIDSIVPDLCLDGLYLAYQKFHEFQQQQELS